MSIPPPEAAEIAGSSTILQDSPRSTEYRPLLILRAGNRQDPTGVVCLFWDGSVSLLSLNEQAVVSATHDGVRLPAGRHLPRGRRSHVMPRATLAKTARHAVKTAVAPLPVGDRRRRGLCSTSHQRGTLTLTPIQVPVNTLDSRAEAQRLVSFSVEQ
jgi:hypothetical protein